MRPDAVLFIYLVVLLGGVVAITFVSLLRRRRFEPAASADRVFRCVSCAYVYTDDPDVDRSRCPQCGTMNEQFKF